MLNDIGKLLYQQVDDHFITERSVLNDYIQQFDFIDKSVQEEFLTYQIYDSITKVSIRVIIEELHRYNYMQDDVDVKSRDRYKLYLKKLKNKDYVKTLFKQYPELETQIINAVKQWFDNYMNFCRHFISDEEEIVRRFGANKSFKKIIKLESGISDRHCGGKSVIKIILDSGDIIYYKPHSVDNESAWYEMVRWFYAQCGMDTFEYPILSRSEYGWCGHVSQDECSDIGQVERFYIRFGIQLFIAWIFGISDLHCENMIAHGEYPMFIDMEIFPGVGGLRKEASADGFADNIIRGSVLRTGALPFLLWDNQGNGVNLSAISENGRIRMPYKVPVVVDPETVNMHIEYIYPEKVIQRNTVHLKQRKIFPYEFTESICEGFAKAWRCISVNLIAFERKTKQLFDLKARYLLRHTQQYSMLLRLSYHPWYMAGYDERMKLLQNINDGYRGCEIFREDIVKVESESLYDGDIPYFYTIGCKRHLYGVRDILFKNYFEQTAQEQFSERLNSINEEVIKQQQEFIRVSMALLKSDINKRDKYARSSGGSFEVSLTDVCKDILQWITSHAVYDDNGEIVNWVGIKLLGYAERQWKLAPLDIYLYDGLAGVAIYINAWLKYTEVCDDRLTAEKAKECLDKVMFKYTDSLCNDKSADSKYTGIFVGEGSIAYTYLILYKITDDLRYLDYAVNHCEILINNVDADKSYDILSGNAGAIIVFLHMFDVTSDSKYLQWAQYTGDILLNRAEKGAEFIAWPDAFGTPPLAGLAHGCSGFIMAFTRLAYASNASRYWEAVEKIMTYEDNLYNETINNWKDLQGIRDKSAVEIFENADSLPCTDQVAWCHGAGGILLSRMEICEVPGCKENHRKLYEVACVDAERALQKISVDGIRDNLCLCHGLFGNLSVLDDVPEVKERFGSVWESGVSMYKSLENSYPHERYNPGFMTGITGIGYTVLRHYNDSLPDMLRLKI